MSILTIDTSLDKTYLTFQDEVRIIESDALNYHSAYLVSGIKDILNGSVPETIGVNVGPGSFTGIRVGVTVARVMGQQLSCNLVGVTSCELLSSANQDDSGISSAVIMDARRSMYYHYDGFKTELISKDDIQKITPQRVVCDDKCLDMLQALGFEAISFEKAHLPLGQCLARLTEQKLKSGGDFHWSRLKPLYIQTPPIFGA